jgi:hypothetical protein
MGAILEIAELMKEPVGWIAAAVVIVGGYFFWKWVNTPVK